MEKIKNLEKALNAVGIQTTLEQVEVPCWNSTYRILILELKNIYDSDGEFYAFLFHPTTHQLIANATEGEKINSSKKLKKR